ELDCRDRLDLPSQSIERVAMNAREKTSVAPSGTSFEATTEHDTLGLELVEERVVALDGSEGLEASTEHSLRVARCLRREPSIALELGAARGGQLVEPRLPASCLG